MKGPPDRSSKKTRGPFTPPSRPTREASGVGFVDEQKDNPTLRRVYIKLTQINDMQLMEQQTQFCFSPFNLQPETFDRDASFLFVDSDQVYTFFLYDAPHPLFWTLPILPEQAMPRNINSPVMQFLPSSLCDED